MNLLNALAGFRGRIGRIHFLLGVALLTFFSPFSLGVIISQNPLGQMADEIRRTGPVGLGWSLLLLILLASLMTRRLHDLGRSGIYAALFYLPAAIEIIRFFSATLPATYRAQIESFTYWGAIAAAWLGVSGLWFLVKLGFYRGQRGPNAFGPAPGKRLSRR